VLVLKSLRGLALEGGDFYRATLREADMKNAVLVQGDFREADLQRTELERSDLSGSDFSRANMRSVDLEKSTLAGIVLREADLRDADIMEADLSGADFTQADIRGATLRRAHLTGARFTGVPFSDEDRLCFPGSCYDRTSTREKAYREATAGVVLDVLGSRRDVVCWNIVPWHPHQPGEPLSNNDPDAETIEYGMKALEWFFHRLYPETKAVAVGKLPEKMLQGFKAEGREIQLVATLRHPARGGANEFRAQAAELLGEPEAEW